MRRGKRRRLAVFFLSFSLALLFMGEGFLSQTLAGPSPAKLVKKAISGLNKAKMISFKYDSIRNFDDSTTEYRFGVVMSDENFNYGTYIDESQSDKGWIEYKNGRKTYRKDFSNTRWNVYTNGNEGKYVGLTKKNWLVEKLKEAKSYKLISTTEKSYVVKGVFKEKDSAHKSVELTIHKKSGKLTKIKLLYNKYTEKYLNSENTYTVTGGSSTLSNISYGDSEIVLPDELQGL